MKGGVEGTVGGAEPVGSRGEREGRGGGSFFDENRRAFVAILFPSFF